MRAPLPNTPFTKAAMKNAPSSQKPIVKVKVRGREAAGPMAANQFAPPPTGAYTDGWFDLTPMPFPPGDFPREWTPGMVPGPQSVRNVELEIVIEVAEGVTKTYVLDITAPDACSDGSTSPLNKLRQVDVTLEGVDQNGGAHVLVQRTYYNTDNQQGCGTGGGQCTTVTDPCVVMPTS